MATSVSRVYGVGFQGREYLRFEFGVLWFRDNHMQATRAKISIPQTYSLESIPDVGVGFRL